VSAQGLGRGSSFESKTKWDDKGWRLPSADAPRVCSVSRSMRNEFLLETCLGPRHHINARLVPPSRHRADIGPASAGERGSGARRNGNGNGDGSHHGGGGSDHGGHNGNGGGNGAASRWSGWSFLSHLGRLLLRRLQLSVRNVHICFQVRRGCVLSGSCLSRLTH